MAQESEGIVVVVISTDRYIKVTRQGDNYLLHAQTDVALDAFQHWLAEDGTTQITDNPLLIPEGVFRGGLTPVWTV